MNKPMDEQQYREEVLDAPAEGLKVRGFFRVKIVDPETGEVAGDSGFNPNVVTNDGFNQYLCMTIGSSSGSKYISHAGLGTGGAPATNATSLTGEVGTRQAVTFATSSSSKTARFTATFAAGWHTSASAHNISNIGLFNSSATGTLFAGNTYASSSCASNQAVNVTYDVIFS